MLSRRGTGTGTTPKAFDYYGPMPCKYRPAATLLALSAFTISSMATAVPGATAPPTAPVQEASDASQAAQTAELMYEVLLGEFTTRSGDPGQGFALLLDAARRSNDGDLYRRTTEIALQSRSAQSALIAARAWQRAQPDSREANRFVLRILVALNQIEESAEPLARELANAPANDKIAVINAIPLLYAHASNKERAAQVVESALADALTNDATTPNAWTTIGRMRLAAGDKRGALLAARLAQKSGTTNDAMAALALQLMGEDVPEAEPLLAPYLAGHPLPEIRLGYARYLSDKNQPERALAQLRPLTSTQPDHIQAWLIQSALELQAGHLDAAEKSLDHFAALYDQMPVSDQPRAASERMYLLRSEIAQARGDRDQAVHWLDQADPEGERLPVQERRAALLAQQGKLGEALAAIQNVPAADDEAAASKLRGEALVLREVGQYERAHEVQAQAIALQPDNDDYLYDQAMLAEKLGRLDEMEQLLRSILARNPRYYHALNALGFSLADHGMRLKEAKALIEQALELAPGDPYITDSLGWAEYRLGNHRRARELLQTAMRKQPDAEIAAHLGEVLWKLGDRARARRTWREGLRLKPDNATLLDTLRRLGVRL